MDEPEDVAESSAISTGAGDVGAEGVRDDSGTPRISARAAGEEEAKRFECRCFWRDLQN